MTLTKQLIAATPDDDALFGLLGAELERRLSGGRTPTDAFVDAVRSMPVGLRAMAATYELDVSLTLDDLGCHFGNWHHEELATETLQGLRELEIAGLPQVFEAALHIAKEYWEELGAKDWMDWYHGSELEKRMEPLNEEAWRILKSTESGILGYWAPYARKHPDRVSPD